MPFYFAYGSNMSSSEILRATQASAISARPGRLEDHRLVFSRLSKGRGHWVANIARAPERSVHGVLYELTDAQLQALDVKEGTHAGAYDRVEVAIDTFEGLGSRRPISVAAFTYIDHEASDANSGHWCHPNYLYLMISGAIEHHLPTDYVDQLKTGYDLDHKIEQDATVTVLPPAVMSEGAGQPTAWVHPELAAGLNAILSDPVVIKRAGRPVGNLFIGFDGHIDPGHVALSASNRNRLELQVDSPVRLETYRGHGWIELEAALGLREDLTAARVRISRDLADFLHLEDQELVEVSNDDSSRRWQCEWRPTKQETRDRKPHVMQISAGARALLKVSIGKTVRIRKVGRRAMDASVDQEGGRLLRLLSKVVGTRTMRMVVQTGADGDEGGKTVRLCESDLAALGLQVGHRVWFSRLPGRLSLRALKAKDGAEGVILVPSTVRLEADIYVGEVIEVSRDPIAVFLRNADRVLAALVSCIALFVTLTRDPFELSIPLAAVTALALGLLTLILLFTTVREQV